MFFFAGRYYTVSGADGRGVLAQRAGARARPHHRHLSDCRAHRKCRRRRAAAQVNGKRAPTPNQTLILNIACAHQTLCLDNTCMHAIKKTVSVLISFRSLSILTKSHNYF